MGLDAPGCNPARSSAACRRATSPLRPATVASAASFAAFAAAVARLCRRRSLSASCDAARRHVSASSIERSRSATREVSAARSRSEMFAAAARSSNARRSHSSFSAAATSSARSDAASARSAAVSASTASDRSAASERAVASRRRTFSSRASQCCLSVALSRDASRKDRAAASSRDLARWALETDPGRRVGVRPSRTARAALPRRASSPSESESQVKPKAPERALPGVPARGGRWGVASAMAVSDVASETGGRVRSGCLRARGGGKSEGEGKEEGRSDARGWFDDGGDRAARMSARTSRPRGVARVASTRAHFAPSRRALTKPHARAGGRIGAANGRERTF